MDILIALTVITLTLPLVTEGGSPLPETKLLTAVYRTDDTQPVAAGVGWPGEEIQVGVPQQYGCWYVTAWDIDDKRESVPSEIVCKRPAYTCGDGCHD